MLEVFLHGCSGFCVVFISASVNISQVIGSEDWVFFIGQEIG